MRLLARLAQRLGYDLVPRRKVKDPTRQLGLVLDRAEVTLVLDVGANIGQYGRRLRAGGYAGRIVSFEPLARTHAELLEAARGDPRWEIAPRMALGAACGEVEIEVSAEPDMSSILGQSELLRAISPSSRITGRERVRLARLDLAAAPYLRPEDRSFLKVDTQGYESAVLDGASGILERLHGLQLELSLVPMYQGEAGFREMFDRVVGLGFEPHLILPGYFERKLARQLQVDVVFMRAGGADNRPRTLTSSLPPGRSGSNGARADRRRSCPPPATGRRRAFD